MGKDILEQQEIEQRELELKIGKFKRFLDEKQSENPESIDPNTRKLYDAAQKVIFILEHLTQSASIEKGRENKDHAIKTEAAANAIGDTISLAVGGMDMGASRIITGEIAKAVLPIVEKVVSGQDPELKEGISADLDQITKEFQLTKDQQNDISNLKETLDLMRDIYSGRSNQDNEKQIPKGSTNNQEPSLEERIEKLEEFLKEKEANQDDGRDTKKLYEAAQNVVEKLKKLSLSNDKGKENDKGQESEEKDKDQGKQQGSGRTKEVLEKVLSPLENIMKQEDGEKAKKEEEIKEEEEKKKKTSLGSEIQDPEKKAQQEQEEQEKKKKQELEEEEKTKEKEEQKLKKSLEETRQTIEEILEHERKMQKEVREKEGNKDIGENAIQALESSLPPLNKALGSVSSKQILHAISKDKEQQKENSGAEQESSGKGNDKLKEVVGQLKGIFGKLGMEGVDNGNIKSPENYGPGKDGKERE